MSQVLKILIISIICMGFFIAEGQAQQPFQNWLEELRREARGAGISRETVRESLSNPRILDSVITADRNQPEFKKNIDAYVAGVLSEARITQGRKMLRRYRTLLKRISEQYGVQPRFIVALWGIETFYGKHTGKVPIIDALVTLAYDNRRGDYFRSELLNALQIIDAGHISYKAMKGSWAGAMGQVQFMPSSFLNFAVDGSGEGIIDLWNTPEDYLSSAANYLVKVGWKNNQTWGREVKLPDRFTENHVGVLTKKLLSEWQQLGLRRLNGQDLPEVVRMASLIQPEGNLGKSYLIYDNYNALMKWNRAHSFAISVGMLADRLRD